MNENLLNEIIDIIPGKTGVMNSSNYLKSSVLASLFEKNNELHLIFQKRNNAIRQGGEICFPGGRFDELKDKDMRETSIRETMEEMGITREKIAVFGQIDTVVAPMGAIINCFLGELKIEDLSELDINKDEVERVFSVPVTWFINNPPKEYDVHMEIKPTYRDEKGKEIILLPVEELGLPDRYRKPWGFKNHKIYAYRTNNETIWGITAQMVKHICELLGGVL